MIIKICLKVYRFILRRIYRYYIKYHFKINLPISIKINGKAYVGKTNNAKKRFQQHINLSKGSREKYGDKFQLVHKALKKYGCENFLFEVIEEVFFRNFIF